MVAHFFTICSIFLGKYKFLLQKPKHQFSVHFQTQQLYRPAVSTQIPQFKHKICIKVKLFCFHIRLLQEIRINNSESKIKALKTHCQNDRVSKYNRTTGSEGLYSLGFIIIRTEGPENSFIRKNNVLLSVHPSMHKELVRAACVRCHY